jgi:hypothetical protein
MPNIRDIGIRDIGIRDIYIPNNLKQEPSIALPVSPPVTQQVGIPIVNIPGCVEAHKDNKENVNLKDADDKGTMTLCDAGTPSFRPIDYDTSQVDLEQEPPKPPAYKAPKKPETPETKNPAVPKTEAPLPECPTRAQQLKDPVGKIVEGNKKIVAYETVGKECLPVFETLSIPDQIVQNIPSAGMVTTTASIAVVATSSALLAKPLADLLLKVVKPTVKKILKKVATLRGKKIPVESVRDRRDEQRQRSAAIRALRLMKKHQKK